MLRGDWEQKVTPALRGKKPTLHTPAVNFSLDKEHGRVRVLSSQTAFERRRNCHLE